MNNKLANRRIPATKGKENLSKICMNQLIRRNIDKKRKELTITYGIRESRETKRDFNLKMGIQILKITASFYTAEKQTTLISFPKSNPKPTGAEKERSDRV